MRLLFVCVHNAGRSQMAEAYANHFAQLRGLDVTAESAGTVGGREVNPTVARLMAEDGVGMDGHAPKVLTQAMLDRTDRVISMGCGVDAEACPTKFVVTEDWALDDPAHQPEDVVRRVRDEVKRRVLALLAEAEDAQTVRG